MKLILNRKSYQTLILSTIPIFILISIDPTFNIQSIVFPIILLVMGEGMFREKIQIQKGDILLISLFVIPMLISFVYNLIFAPDNLTSLYFIRIGYTLTVFLFYFLATSIKLDSREIKYIFIFNIVAGVLVSLYFIFVDPIWYINLLGITIDKNFTGGILAIQGELAFYLFYYERKKTIKILYTILFLIICAGVFYSASRASMLVIIGGALMVIAEDLFFDIKKRNKFFKLILAGFFLVFVFIFIFPNVTDYLSANSNLLWYWKRYFVNSYKDGSNASRLAYWKEGIDLWFKKPVFGYGVGVNVVTKGSAVAHNTFIDYMVDVGLVGLIGFLIICIRSTKTILFRNGKSFRALPVSLFLLCIILSLERSVLLWYTLIIIWLIGNSDFCSVNK